MVLYKDWVVVDVDQSHGSDVNCVRINPQGTLLASASDDGTCGIWELDLS